MKNFKLFEKLWEHGRTLRRVGLVLVMCLIAIPQMWAGDWFTDGMWQVYGWDGSSNGWHWTGIGKNNDCELGVMTSSRSITIKGVGANTNQDSGGDVTWVGVHCFYLDGTDAWLDLIYRGKTGNNKYWDSQMLWDLSIDKTVTPGNYYFGMDFWMNDGGSNYNKNYRQIKWTIPGFVDAPASKNFGTAPTNSEAETTISFTHYGNALTTGNCSITGTNRTEFEVRSISESGVTVVFKPSSNGSKSATLTINDGTGLNYSSVSISLSGTAGTSGTVTRLYFNDYQYSGAGDWAAASAKYRFTCTYTSGVVTRYNMTKCDNTEHTYYADVDVRSGYNVSIDRYNPSSPYVTWNTATPTSPALSSTNPYAKSTTISGAYATSHPYNDVTGGTFYYDNSESGFENYLFLAIGRDYRISDGASEVYSDKYALSNITNTKLYYNNASKSWHDATYYGVVANSSSSPSWGTSWGSSTLSTKGSSKGYTAPYTSLFGLLSGSSYLASSPSKSGGTMTISKIDGLPNCSITVAAKVKPAGGAYAAGASKGALSASAMRFNTATSCGTGTSASVSAGSTSDVLIAGYTCTKCTLTVSSVANGYTFRGWYDANGTQLSTNTSYTGYLPKGDATVYAYFEEDTYTITYNNMTGATNPGSNPSSYTVNSSTITLANPSKSDYGFGGWYSDEDCTTRVYSIANGSHGNKVFYAKWLTPHEPGYYVSNSPGYNVTLTTYSSLKYELYRYAASSPNYYLCAGETPTTSDVSYNFLNGNKTGSTYHWDANSWIGHTNVYNVSSSSLSAKNEFPEKTAGTLYCRDQQGLVICIKGYKQFSYWGEDASNDSKNEKQFKVYFNGVDSTKGRDDADGGTIRRYTLDSTKTYVIEILGNTDNNNFLYGFSMRPGRPKITSSSLSGAEYAQGASATPLSVTATKLVSSGTSLSYQWYANTTNAATVDNEHKITGATSASYTPSTTSAGTTYYYCVVSETGCNSTTSSVSGAITVTASCSATADAGDDKATKTGKGVAMAATAATSGYTGAWSIKDGSPSTSTSQLSSTSAYNATFTPTAEGTYTLIWTVADDTDGSCYATDEADVVVTAPSSDATFSSVTIGGETATISGSAGSYTAKIDRPHKGFSLTQDVTFTTNDANATVKLTNSSGEVVTSVEDHDFSSANLVLYVLAEDGSTSATYTLSITNYDKYLVYLTTSASPSENIYSTISDYAEDNNYKLSAWDVSTSLTAANMASRYDLVILAEAPKSDNTTAQAVGSAIGNVPVLSFKGYMFGKTNWPTGAGNNPGTGSSALKVITTKTPCHDIFDGLSLTGDSKDITILSSNPASGKNGVQLISGVSASGWRSLADKEISSTTYSALLEYVGTSGSNKALVIPISNDACSVISSATETIIGNAIDYLLDNSALYTINTTKTISVIHVEESDDSDITDNGDGTYSLESEDPIDEDDNAVSVTLSSSCASYSVDYSDLTEGYGDVTVTVTAESGATGTYTLTVTAPVTCTAPTIGSGPSNVSICSGSTTTLSVSSITGGTTPYTYRWYDASDDSEVSSGSGYTTASFTTPTLDAEASYYCIVTEDNGCTTKSGTATVSMKTDVSITTQPSSVANAVVGTASTLTIVAAGTSPTYQWYTCDDDKKTNAAAISSGSNASAITDELNITPGAVGTTYYYCVVDGCGGPLTSDVVSITAKNQPAQYTVSGTASICSGDNTNITLSNSEDGVSYQLYKDGVAEGDPVDGTSDAIVWSVSAEGMYTVKAVGDANYWERAMSGSATVSFKTAASISTQPTTAVAATEGENFTLGSGMVVAGTGTKSYQWYSYSTSGGADETEIEGAESATYTTSKAAAGTYYYKVKVSADCGTATSNMITVTVTSGPCFTMTANTSAGSNGSLSHNESIAEGSDNCSDLDGGTAKYVDAGASNSMEVNKNYGWNFNHNDDQIIVTLSAGYSLQEGSIITLSGYANSSGNGIQINGKTVYTKPSTSGAFADVTYTVLSTDAALKGANELVIKRVSGGVYLSSISFSGCDYCEPITPTLSYSKTTFWLDEESDDLWGSPTLDKDGSTGTVTYTSSDPSIVWVSSSTGNILAEGRGTATITASIAADGTHCATEATCKIIVKSIECGETVIAGVTLSAKDAGTPEGTLIASSSGYVVSTQKWEAPDGGCGTGGKLGADGNYVCLTLKSGESFKNGDKVIVNIAKVPDVGDTKLHIYAGTSSAGTQLGEKASPVCGTNEITLSGISSSTPSITLYRTTGDDKQNPYVVSMKVKRYTCPDIFVFNDAENDQSWSTAGNWLGKAGQGTGLPKDTDRVYIKKSVSVDATTATAGRVHIVDGAVMTVEKSVTMGKVDVETGSTLHVAKDGGSGVTLTLNTLYLKGGWNDDKSKYDMPRVYINSASSLTKEEDVVNFDISVNHWNYYPIALPFDVALNDVDYARSDLALESTYGTHYAIYEYDGQKRANYGGGSNNWKYMNYGSTLKAGKGYILSAIPDGGKAIIRFPMTFTDAWTAGGEKGEVEDEDPKNVITVTAYENNIGGETSLANKGWNLIGVPYMSCYTTGSGMYTGDGTATLIQGRFDYETGKWTEKGANFYVTVPTHDFTEFKQSPVGEAVLIPGWCFFVQVKETGNLLFLDGQQASSSSSSIYEAPRREMSMPTLKTGIILSGNEASDQTTILVSDRYSASEYEINADLEKMFGETGYTLATYSLSGSTRLAYNALSNADAANIIPIGYRAPVDGDYTFSINPRYAQNGAFESVNLIDYETGIVTDLLLYSYTFTTTRTQNDARFALNIVKRQDTTTDIENGASEANDVRKLIINDQLYIIVDGKMYDATGKAVK